MEFEIEKVLPNGLGRVGTIKTAHGEIKTPAFMAVGTRGYVRFISPQELHKLGAQAMLSNGYHLRRQAPEIAKAGGLANILPSFWVTRRSCPSSRDSRTARSAAASTPLLEECVSANIANFPIPPLSLE